MKASYGLAAVNFFMADVGGGLGPFLSTWLAAVAGFGSAQIGWVIAVGSIIGALLAGPAGSIVDRLAKPRLMLAVATGAILLGTLILVPARAFWLIVAAQILVSAGGALGSPSISGLTLAVVGKDGYPRQQGNNEASNHAGNVTAAAAIALLSWWIGPIAAVVILAVMAVATLITLWRIDSEDVDADRMRGRKRREKGAKRGATRAIFKNKHLWLALAIVGLFQMGSSSMLPLLGQRIVQEGSTAATAWMSGCVVAASLTMIPVALLVGRNADRFGRKKLLLAALAVLIGRCALALFAVGRFWLIPIEILDGIGAATFSVTVPILIADLTYGSGRTQTAMGTMAMVQAGGAALASVFWGYTVTFIGYTASFGAMAAFPAVGIVMLLFLGDQPEADDASKASAGKAAAMSAAA